MSACEWCGRPATGRDRDGDPACRPGVGCLQRAPKRYEHDGQRLTLNEWAARSGINRSTLYQRMQCGGKTLAEAIAMAPSPFATKRKAVVA